MHIFQRRSTPLLSILFLCAVINLQPTPALAKTLACDDLQGNIYQNGKNEELQRQAKLSEWNRYHDYIISGLCGEDMRDLNDMVDQGYLSLSDVQAVAAVLGKNYNPPSRTKNGKLYQQIREGLLKQNLCSACASNLADEYVNRPGGRVKQLIDKALVGNQSALHELQQLPSSTPLDNQSETSPSFLSKLLGSMSVIALLLLYVGVIAFLVLSVFSKRFRAKLHQHYQKWNAKYKQLAAILGVGIITIVIFSDSRTPEEKACSGDWRKCIDNQQLIDTGIHHGRMASACEREASKRAKYGEPKFPTFSFGNYQPGRAYVETGIVYLVERDAQFQNMYGTQVHTEVTCKYDLNRNQVEDVVIWN